MKAFNVAMTIIQTAAVIGAVVVAWFIGKRQTDIIKEQTAIAKEQAAISRRQTEIGEATLNLQYAMSLEIDFDVHEMTLVLRNRGQTNIYYSGCRFHNQTTTREGPRSTIAPNAEFFVPGDWVELLELADCIGRSRSPVSREQCFHGMIYVTDEHNVPFLIGTTLFVDVEDGRWSVRASSSVPKRKPVATFVEAGTSALARAPLSITGT